MKTVTTIQQAFELVPCDADSIKKAATDFEHFAPLSFRNRPGLLNHLTQEGFIKAEQVFVDSKPAFTIFWTKTLDRFLSVNACQSLRSGVSIEVAFMAAEAIRKREKCIGVRMASVRRGLLEMAQRFGYEFDTIVMRKA